MSGMQGIPAAWYPDPSNGRMLRYWDGTTWTDQVRESGILMAPTAVNAPISDFTGYDRVGQTNAAYVPFGRGGAAESAPRSGMARGGTTTSAIWLYAFAPLFALVHLFIPWTFTVDDLTNIAVHILFILFPVILAVLFAAVDRSQLRNRGYLHTPPALVGLIPPVHVILRAFTTGPGAIGVALVALLVQAGVVVLMLGIVTPFPTVEATPTETVTATPGMTPPFTPAQQAYLLTAEGMEEKIAFDSSVGALTYDSVDCVPLASTDLGTQTTCVAKTAIASYALVVQVLPDGTNAPFVIVSVTPSLN